MQNISVEELKARMEAGEKLHLIDCREPHEYAEFNIGGTLIPLGKFQSFQVERRRSDHPLPQRRSQWAGMYVARYNGF